MPLLSCWNIRASSAPHTTGIWLIVMLGIVPAGLVALNRVAILLRAADGFAVLR